MQLYNNTSYIILPLSSSVGTPIKKIWIKAGHYCATESTLISVDQTLGNPSFSLKPIHPFNQPIHSTRHHPRFWGKKRKHPLFLPNTSHLLDSSRSSKIHNFRMEVEPHRVPSPRALRPRRLTDNCSFSLLRATT